MPKPRSAPKKRKTDGAARAASRRIFATTERELPRIGLGKHHGPGGDIFPAVSHLQLLERGLDEQSQRRVRQAILLLERTLLEIRNFIGAFRPPGFERRGLP